MRKPFLVPIILVLLLIAALVLLSTQAREVPVGPIETEVERGGDAR